MTGICLYDVKLAAIVQGRVVKNRLPNISHAMCTFAYVILTGIEDGNCGIQIVLWQDMIWHVVHLCVTDELHSSNQCTKATNPMPTTTQTTMYLLLTTDMAKRTLRKKGKDKLLSSHVQQICTKPVVVVKSLIVYRISEHCTKMASVDSPN